MQLEVTESYNQNACRKVCNRHAAWLFANERIYSTMFVTRSVCLMFSHQLTLFKNITRWTQLAAS